MMQRRRDDVLRQVDQLFGAGTLGGLTDDQLLRRFVARHDDPAFEALVERHGPMVLRVCRAMLGDRHDVDDAFQATFVVLARRAGSLRVGDSLGRWLFGVARRAAMRVRRDAARRSRYERGAALECREAERRGLDPDRAEAAAIVAEEVERLPGAYRSPVVLCYLQGLTYEEAAARLRVTEATVRGRLARARRRLRVRLVARGVGVSVAAALAAVSKRSATAVPAPLVEAAVRAATSAGAISPAVLALGNRVLKEMAMKVLKTNATVLLMAGCGLFAARCFLARSSAGAADSPPGPSAVAREGDRAEHPAPVRPRRDEPALLVRRVTPKPWQTTVRIQVHGSGELVFGSGTVIRSDPGESLILTCAHIFKLDARTASPPVLYPHRITVDLFDGVLPAEGRAQVRFSETIAAEMVDYDPEGDVGLLRIRPGRKLRASPIVPSGWTPSKGMDMVSAGCPEGNDATFWTTQVMKSGTVRLFNDRRAEFIECQYAPKQGRTGGGLFTTGDELAGVCNFAEPRGDRGYYAAPASIYRILDRHRLASLYRRGMGGADSLAESLDAARSSRSAADSLGSPGMPAAAPSLDDHERRLREVERTLEQLLRERTNRE